MRTENEASGGGQDGGYSLTVDIWLGRWMYGTFSINKYVLES